MAYEYDVLDGVNGGAMITVEVDPQNPDTVYAASWYDLWKSVDRGASWSHFKYHNLIQFVVVDPTASGTIYMACRNDIQKTVNGGADWVTLTGAGLGGSYAFAIDPNNTDYVYTGGTGVIYYSTDAGASWTATGVVGMGIVHVIRVDPNDSSVLYAGCRAAKIWKSTDYGHNWVQIASSTGSRVSVDVPAANSNIVYATGQVSHDAGITWKYSAPTAWCIRAHPTNPLVAYYAEPGNPVKVTTDGGLTFSTIQGIKRNYDATEAESMAIDVTNDVLYVGGDTLFAGSGVSTGRVNVTPHDSGIYGIAFTDIDVGSGIVWVSSDTRGVHRSTDQGASWQYSVMGMEGLDSIRKLAPHPTDNNICYAGHEGTVFKTVDQGQSWFGLFTTSFPRPSIDPLLPSTVYVGDNNNVLRRSTDSGATWEILDQAGKEVFVDPIDSSVIYAVATGYLHVSYDKGDTWAVRGTAPGTSLYINPYDSAVIYSPVDLNGLYRSTNSGATFSKITTFTDTRPRDVVVQSGGRIWVTAYGGSGLYTSDNDGSTWDKPITDSTLRVAVDPWNPDAVFCLGTPPLSAVYWVHPDTDTQMEANPPADDNPEFDTIMLSGCQLLNRSNTRYVLTSDLVALGTGPGLMFPRGIHDVTIDGDGHSIMSTTSPILGDGLDNITVENIYVTQSGTSIAAGESDTIHLSNSTNVLIRETTSVATRRGTSAISIPGIMSNNVEVANAVVIGATLSTATAEFDGPGLVVFSGSSITQTSTGGGLSFKGNIKPIVADTNIYAGGPSSSLYGINFVGCVSGVITGTTVSGVYTTSSAALNMLGCRNMVVAQDTSLATDSSPSNGGEVFSIVDTHDSRFRSITMAFKMRNHSAMSITDSTGNIFSCNVMTANSIGSSGLKIVNSSGNIFEKNSFTVTGQDSTVALTLSGAVGNIFHRNNFTGNTDDILITGSGANTWNGNYYSKSSPGCTDDNSDGFCDIAAEHDADNIDNKPSTTTNSQDCGTRNIVLVVST